MQNIDTICCGIVSRYNTTVSIFYNIDMYRTSLVRSLITVFEELGNPFEEKSQDLLVLDTREIADSAVVNTILMLSELVRTISQRNAY